MKPVYKLGTTLALIALLGGLAGADYYFSGSDLPADITDGTVTEVPATGVVKDQGPSVESAIQELGLTAQRSDDLTLLAQVATDGPVVTSLTILSNGDRAGSVSWIQTGEVKTVFAELKEALLGAFSADLEGLRDETIQTEGKPVRDILTFFDPSLSEEKIVFVRVRERLYEFHLRADRVEVMNGLIDTLTGR